MFNFHPLSTNQCNSNAELPNLVAAQRAHLGIPSISRVEMEIDRDAWNRLPVQLKEVIVHVLSRIGDGLARTERTREHLCKVAVQRSPYLVKQHQEALEDVQSAAHLCQQYRLLVAGMNFDLQAMGAAYCHLIDGIIPDRTRDLEQAQRRGSQRESVNAELALRTVYSLIAEGLGLVSGVWGLSSEVQKINANARLKGEPELKGLNSVIDVLIQIEQRAVAMSLSEMRTLIRTVPFNALPIIGREYLRDIGTLNALREETWARWPNGFPCSTVNKAELSAAAKALVRGWGRRFLFPALYSDSQVGIAILDELFTRDMPRGNQPFKRRNFLDQKF